MLGQSVNILGQEYKVSSPTPKQSSPKTQKQQTELQDLYYMEVVGERSHNHSSKSSTHFSLITHLPYLYL